ncbi:MAG: AI-2E family transporter [Clostridia bacterium]|nr:AI-2E family transporter [Clostridia bacterium]
MERKNSAKRWLWTFTLVAAAILLYKLYDNFTEAVGLVGRLIRVLGPFVGGFVLAFFMHGPSNLLEKQFLKLKGKWWAKLARPLALAITYIALLGVLALLFYLVIPAVVESISALVAAMPDYYASVMNVVDTMVEPGGLLESLGLEDKVQEVYNALLGTLTEMVTTENLVTAIRGVGNVATSIINVVIAVIVSLYMLGGREHLIAAVKNFLSLFLKPHTLATVSDYTRRTGTIFYKYFYGAFLDSLCVGIVVSIGLLIFRVPYAVLLGMALGLMNMIPYFGAIVGCVVIALVTLLTNGFYTALGVAIYIIVIQQVDANIIQPRVVGDFVGLRPIYVLLSVTLFGGLFGFWGVFLAPPLMAIIQMFVRDATIARKKKLAAESAAPQDEEAKTE